MGKEKRKTRLDKVGTLSGSGSLGGTEFIGFAAFATSTVPNQPPAAASPNGTSSQRVSSAPLLPLTPIYTGHDERFQQLLSRIGPKRDAVTKVKALQELQSYLTTGMEYNDPQQHNSKSSHSASSSSSTNTTNNTSTLRKKQQVVALQHLAWWYHTSLHADRSPAVRAEAWQTWLRVYPYLTKAVTTLTTVSEPELLALFLCTATDPATEVRQVAVVPTGTTTAPLSSAPTDLMADLVWNIPQYGAVVQQGLLQYAQRILSYGKSTVMHQAMMRSTPSLRSSQSEVGSDQHRAPSKNNNNNNNNTNKNEGSTTATMTEEQKDAMEERFERLVGTCLDALTLWIHKRNQATSTTEETTTWEELQQVDIASTIVLACKTVTNPKPSLRRRTYQLVTAVCSFPRWSFLLNLSSWMSALQQSLSTEKDAMNMPALLECMLATLVLSSRQEPTMTATLQATLHKPLLKLFKKACFGASVPQWGPTLLPLVATFWTRNDDHDSTVTSSSNATLAQQQQALALLRAVWDGRELTLGDADFWSLLSALAECTSFCLLRRTTTLSSSSSMTVGLADDTVRAVAALWLHVLHECLDRSPPPAVLPSTSPVGRAYQQLLQRLAQTLKQFQQAEQSQRGCAWIIIRSWFWTTGLPEAVNAPSSRPDAWVQLLRAMQQHDVPSSTSSAQPEGQDSTGVLVGTVENNSWLHILQQRFFLTMQSYQGSSGHVPTLEAYTLMMTLLQVAGPLLLTDGLASSDEADRPRLGRFIMNDVLRWTILHTSRLSTHSRDARWIGHDFRLLSLCLKGLPLIERAQLWETFLKELMLAHVHTPALMVGFQLLIQEHSDALDWIPCETFDRLATDVAVSLSQSTGESNLPEHTDQNDKRNDHEVDSSEAIALDFYCLCLGLVHPCLPRPLIHSPVLTKWVDLACPAPGEIGQPARKVDNSPLVEALFQLLQSNTSILGDDEVRRLVQESWRIGGRLHTEYVLELVKDHNTIGDELIVSAAAELRAQLSGFVVEAPSEHVVEWAREWSSRAWRIFDVCHEVKNQRPSLELVGIGDLDLWKNHPDLLLLCTLLIFETIEPNGSARLKLVQESTQSASELLVTILISTSGGSLDPVLAERASRKEDGSARFLTALGRALDDVLADILIRDIIESQHESLRLFFGTSGLLARKVAVLSQLLTVLFPAIVSSDVSSELDSQDVKEGAQLWYIADTLKPNERESVTVVKVHYDAQAGYFFTIRYNRSDADVRERQTIIERLRQNDKLNSTSGGLTFDDISKEDWQQRKPFRDILIQHLIKPSFVASKFESPPAAELICVATSAIGLGTERGLGSAYYEIFQMVVALELNLRRFLDANDKFSVAEISWSLALALGYGLNAPESKYARELIKIDQIPSQKALIDHWPGGIIGSSADFDHNFVSAVLVWLTVCAQLPVDFTKESAASITTKSLRLLFQLSASVLSPVNKPLSPASGLIVCRAIYQASRQLVKEAATLPDASTASELSTSQVDALERLVHSFCTGWNVDPLPLDSWLHDGAPLLAQDPTPFPKLVSLYLKESNIRPLILKACGGSNADMLSRALFNPTKRFQATKLLDAMISQGDPIQSADDVKLCGETEERLKNWTHGLEDEGVAEVEQDVYIVAEWVPLAMMKELEHWYEDEVIDHDAITSMGRMLTWLLVLRCIEVSAPKDFLNRPAFVSYLRRCNAYYSILNLALLNDETVSKLGTKKKRKMDTMTPILDMKDILLHDEESSWDLSLISSLVLFRTVEVLPSLSRRWWEDECPKVYLEPVQNFVELQVAPQILERELSRIKSSQAAFGDMQVSASLQTRQITAMYEQDDFTLQVLIRLPPAFPFKSAEVDCSKTLGVNPERWRRWSFQIRIMLNDQGGTLQDALTLWKTNVDREFEGKEPCPVCYSVLHVKTHKLPSLECKTCHNRFHVDCLTQWFRSSGKNQCVLCQQPWQGTRV